MPAAKHAIPSTTPWLSVLIPVYNGTATIGQCLKSISSQSEGIEIIIVDQGSSDHSVQIAESLSDRLNLRIISAPQNTNWVQNTNLALEDAQAPYCTLLHQDDLWLPNRTQILSALTKQWPDAALWVHAAQYIDSEAKPLGKFQPPFGKNECQLSSTEALKYLLVQNTIALPAVMFRTEDARKIGGLDESLWYTADWDFWLKLAKLGPLAWHPWVGTAFRLHIGSQTVTGSRNLEDFSQQLTLPVARHLPFLPTSDQPEVRNLAEVSNLINIWLAARYHGQAHSIAPILRRVFSLGPVGIIRLLNRSRVIQRMRPRLSLRR